jgi:DNA-binding transcriptional LysR family regulator
MTDKPQLRDLDLNLLVVFDAVLHERSVGRAAQHLGLSQPAVSHALSRLRQALDDELFMRNGSGMQPTPRALELGQPVREGLELLQDAVAPPVFAPEHATRCFSLALSDYASTVILAKLVRALRAQAPGIDLQIFPANRVDVVVQLDRGRIDLAITWVDQVPERLSRETLWEESEVYVVDAAHPVAAAGGLCEEALLAFPQVVVDLVGFDGQTESGFLRERGLSRRVHIERAFAERRLFDHGTRGRIVVTTPHYREVLSLVAKTDLIGVLPRRVARAAAARHDVVLLEPPYDAPPAQIDMIWHKRRDADSGLRWLRELLTQVSCLVS